MSKSSYDEALDILRDSLQDPQDEDDDCYCFNFEQLNNIAKIILHAQKQEKLLELYRELMTVKDESISLLFIGNYNNDMEEIETKLERQIKELENE